LRARLGVDLHRLLAIGSYAVPLPLPSPTLAQPAQSAANGVYGARS
jgi:hypothetical protein